MSEEMEPIDPIHAAMLLGRVPEPCEPIIEITRQSVTRLLDVVEFGDQLERAEKDRLVVFVKEALAQDQPELWAMHCVGPNEVHPMNSREAAERHAGSLIALCKERFPDIPITVNVIPSPFSPLEHFEILAEELTEQVASLRAECERLKGITPEPPPRPPEGDGLPRYGLRWNGPSQPLTVPMDDGYWTPWHLASKAADDYTDMLSRTSLECGERLEAMETQLAERDALLRELHAAWEESEGHEALFGAMGKVAVLLSASAEPADSVATLMEKHRIAVTPEHEGQWHADLYADESEPVFKAEGDTPEQAVRNVLMMLRDPAEGGDGEAV